MRARIVAAVVSLAAVAGAAVAQPPTAPPPRPVPDLTDLKFFYTNAPPPPVPGVEVSVKGERVELRWESATTSYIATGAKAVVRNGAVILVGTDAELAVLRTTGKGPGLRGDGSIDRNVMRGRRIMVSTADNTVTVEHAGFVETPAGR
jgi:hypothetical protein